MRAAVLFAGIGGWEIACEANGIEVAWAAEWDDWKRERYLERWPGAHLMRDVAEIDGQQIVKDRGPVDVLLGSPPCTDISAANVGGKGIEGDESRYYLEAIRLARETGARWIGFENSPRLRTRGADRVLTLLDEAGYAIWPCVVEAEDAGAPHERGRSFVLGCRRDAFDGSDTERSGLWQQQGWRGWQGRTGKTKPEAHDSDAVEVRSYERGRFETAASGNESAISGICHRAHADTNGKGQPDRAKHGEMGWRQGADGAADECGGEASNLSSERRGSRRQGRSDPGVAGQQEEQCARPTPCRCASRERSEWQGVGGDPFEKLSPAERAALCPWDHRGDGLAGYLFLADELANRLRGHGLSERAVKAELARWRSALGDALVIPVVWAVVRSIVRTDAGLAPKN